jgi:anti-sigma factor RsiW
MSLPLSEACKAVLVNISSYLDGEVDATTCDEIERHCETCPSCTDLVNGLRETVGLCREAGSVPLPEALRQRARDSVRRLLDREAGTNRSPTTKRDVRRQ